MTQGLRLPTGGSKNRRPYPVLQGRELWERAMIRRAVKLVEVSITSLNNSVIQGYLSGIDQDWIQLVSTHTELKPVWVSIQNIAYMNETGTRAKDESEEDYLRIKELTQVFRNLCGSQLASEETAAPRSGQGE